MTQPPSSQPPDRYILHTDRTGAIARAEAYHSSGGLPPGEVGETIPLTGGAGRQQVEAWYSARFHRNLDWSTTFLPDAAIFLHEDLLVKACKEDAFTLHCLPGLGFSTYQSVGGGSNTFHQLATTFGIQGSPGQDTVHDDTVGFSVKWYVPPEVLETINKSLSDEDSLIRRVSSRPIVRTFVYVDISDFSKFTARQEALVINSLVWLVKTADLWLKSASNLPERIEARMCIGDGYIFVFKEPMEATYFAAYLAHLIEVAAANKQFPVSFHFRMGVHVGEVYTFWDPGRRDWNYIGDGINGGNRVLSAIDKNYDDLLYVSGEVRHALMQSSRRFPSFSRLLDHLHNRGRRQDKHGRPWRVYEVGHAAVCQPDLPAAMG
jgi:class 3 adenylate cyclase